MKRIFAIFIVICGIFAVNNHIQVQASAVQIYAMIKSDTTLFDAEFNAVTTLPYSYFVTVEGEQAEDYYAVKYNGLSGFVPKENLQIVDFEPKTKYHSATFTASNDTFPTNIRANPDSDSALLGTIPLGDEAYFFGSIEGEALNSAGSLWHFVRFGEVFGYVYCGQGQTSQIPLNIIEKAQNPVDLSPNNPENTLDFKWIYIALPVVCAIIAMLSLYSRPKKQRQN